MTEKQEQIPATQESALADGAEASEEDIWSEFDNEEAAADGGREASAENSADGEGQQEAADLEANDDNPPAGDEPAGEPDLWSGASEQQRAAYEAAAQKLEKLEQYRRSNEGRVAALQRRIEELAGRQQPAAAPAAAGKDEAKAGSQSADNFTESEEWKSFSEEYPEVAGPLAKFIGSLESRVTHQQKELAAIGYDRRKTALDEQASLLEADHPDWRDVAGNNEFVDWVHTQPRHIQEAAYRNANEIVDAAEAADVVGRFKAFRSASKNPPGSAPGKTNERLAGKRQRQLESAAATRTRGPGVVSGIDKDGDPETIWRQLDEQEAREARRA